MRVRSLRQKSDRCPMQRLRRVDRLSAVDSEGTVRRSCAPSAAVMGLLLLVLPAFFAVIWIDSKGRSIGDYQPAWWLVFQAGHASGSTRANALNRLLHRYDQGVATHTTTLGPAQMHAMFDRILDLQADPNQIWTTIWGNEFERAQARGDVTPEQWQRYLTQAVAGSLTLRARPRVGPGHSIPIEIVHGASRVGTG